MSSMLNIVMGAKNGILDEKNVISARIYAAFCASRGRRRWTRRHRLMPHKKPPRVSAGEILARGNAEALDTRRLGVLRLRLSEKGIYCLRI